MESLNIAALWRLPLIFVCENNGYCEFSPTDTVTAGAIDARAAAFGIPSDAIDGNDVEPVWRTADAAIARARRGDGPSFIEAQTYRLRGHAEAEVHWLSEAYRTEEEVAALEREGSAAALCRAAVARRRCRCGDARDHRGAVIAAHVERAAQAAAKRRCLRPSCCGVFPAGRRRFTAREWRMRDGKAAIHPSDQ